MMNSQHMPFKVVGPHYYNDFFGRVIHEPEFKDIHFRNCNRKTPFSYLPINYLIPLVWHMSAEWQHSY